MESLANDPRFSRCWTRIDLDTIAQNYENARALCRSQLIPVLKADAYGMGAVRVARVLIARGAKLFAVATHAEAMELKNALPCDVLVMGLVGEAELDEAIARGVILAVFSLEYARAVSAHAKARPARVHFKVDTGLHRLGFSSLEELRAEAAAAKRLVYACDNCGEVVLDMLLMEEMKKENPGLQITALVPGVMARSNAEIVSAGSNSRRPATRISAPR